MSNASPIVMWFRSDLRLADNPALLAACETGVPVIPLFILDDTQDMRPLGGASLWWLDRSLRSLAASLSELGASLVLRRGPPLEVLEDIVARSGAKTVHWNRLYDPQSVNRDRAVKESLTRSNILCRSFNAALLQEPWEVKTAAGGPFKVFSAFWRVAGARAGRVTPQLAPTSLVTASPYVPSDDLDDWRLYPATPDWAKGFGEWTPGEAGAQARLDQFFSVNLVNYAKGRDRPDRPYTSRLSPHLHFGEIGPQRLWDAAQRAEDLGASGAAVETFQKELGWREFNHHLLFHFPHIVASNLNRRFDEMPWQTDGAGLAAWRQGRTGFPIVDAGMRQLWTSGWMHNRVRMIVASFLVKDLLIDWRLGESWFWDTLVDADLANNVGGWQWVAGSGADAAPYFRVFNPVLQGETFDPNGEYVRQWVPELGRLPNRNIHAPWLASAETLALAGVTLGKSYPAPILDHARARRRALELYEGLA